MGDLDAIYEMASPWPRLEATAAGSDKPTHDQPLPRVHLEQPSFPILAWDFGFTVSLRSQLQRRHLLAALLFAGTLAAAALAIGGNQA